MKHRLPIAAAVLLLASFALAPLRAASAPEDIFAANRKLGRGINLGNFLEAPKGASWGITIRDEDFRVIKQAGFDSVRLPVRWPDYAMEKAPYTIDAGFFARVDHLLDVAARNGLNVVLNIHHYEGLDKDPAAHTERFVALWKQIAPRYRSRPASLYFELNNEPHDKLDAAAWNAVLVQGLAAVRESNPTRPVIIGPASWNNLSALPKLVLPKDEHLIATFHYYNPFEFTHQGAEWTDPKVRAIRDRAWGGSEADLAAVRKDFDRVVQWAKENHRPIYLGEFGAYSKAPQSSREKWTSAVAREAEARGFSWAYWEYAAGFGAYDPAARAWREPLLKALLPAGK